MIIFTSQELPNILSQSYGITWNFSFLENDTSTVPVLTLKMSLLPSFSLTFLAQWDVLHVLYASVLFLVFSARTFSTSGSRCLLLLVISLTQIKMKERKQYRENGYLNRPSEHLDSGLKRTAARPALDASRVVSY